MKPTTQNATHADKAATSRGTGEAAPEESTDGCNCGQPLRRRCWLWLARWHRLVIRHGAILILFCALHPPAARADALGGDLPILAGIFAQASETVVRINDQLRTARQTYDEIRRFAGYADEAADAFRQFSDFNSRLFSGDVQGTLDHAFPELASIRDEASRLSNGGRFGESSGELRRLVEVCLTVGQCARAREAVSFRETHEALTTAFGLAPAQLRGLGAADDEAAIALAQSTADMGRTTVTRAYAAELMKKCQTARSAHAEGAAAACEAAAAAAQIAQLESDANLSDSLAQGNRLQAMQLLLQAEERKRELREAQERRNLLLDGAKEMARPPPRVETEGFDLLQGAVP